MTLIIKLII